MNIENVNRAADAYLAESNGPAAVRLEFLKGLWALQAGLAEMTPAQTVPEPDAALEALAAGQPIFSAASPSVPADVYQAAVDSIITYVLEAGVLEEGEAAALADADVSSALADAPVASAVQDFDLFVTQVSRSLESASDAAPSLATLAFILHSALVPFMVTASEGALEAMGDSATSGWASGQCPVCGAAAAMGRMGESTKLKGSERTLWCSQCHAEWSYERLRCARCGSRIQSKLRYAYEESDPAHRLHLCDECHGYLKVTFEDAMDKPTEMVVEEAASMALDAIARAEGYTATGTDD